MMQKQSKSQDDAAEVVSGQLPVELLQAELLYVVEELHALDVERVSVTHWMGKEEVLVSALTQAFRDGLDSQGVTASKCSERLGLSDFYLFADGIHTQFEFCHHHELHVISNDERLLERFISRWQSLGYNSRRLQSL
jgi:hypothetical protein